MSQEKKKARAAFRDAVFKRDGYKCRMCGFLLADGNLDAHHITDRNLMPGGGYVKENGITLCDIEGGCHQKAEMFHNGLTIDNGFMPDDLYKLINSSYEIALRASKKLR